MLSKEEFIKAATNNNSMESDPINVWCRVQGLSVEISHCLNDKKINEVSEMLEDDTKHELWNDLYSKYNSEDNFEATLNPEDDLWYATIRNNDLSDDWRDGTSDLSEAKDTVRAWRNAGDLDAYIEVIKDNECIGEIRDF